MGKALSHTQHVVDFVLGMLSLCMLGKCPLLSYTPRSVFYFETGSYQIAQTGLKFTYVVVRAGLELMIFLL